MLYNRITHYIVPLLFLLLIKAQDFSPGPYGINYFDIAGPFIIEDLGVRQGGDLDGDRFVNLKDILLYTSYLDGEIDFSEFIMVMYLGKIVEYGASDQVFNNPKHPYTKALLSSAPTTKQWKKDKQRNQNTLKQK